MKIKNISVKPICIGDASLLPGDTAEVGDTFADAVGFYISMGLMQEVQEKKTRGKAKAGQEPDSDAPAEAEWKMPCVSRTQPTRSVWPTSKPRCVSWTQR